MTPRWLSKYSKSIAVGLTAAFICLAQGSSALAADAGGKFSVRGVGSDRCESLSAAFSKKDDAAVNRYVSWILGYASASNKFSTQTYDALPSKDGRDLIALIVGYCQQNAAVPIEVSTSRVLGGLKAVRLTQESPLVSFSSEGKALEIREESVRFIERTLKISGYYKGAETGKSSPQLIAAIKAFQVAQKLPATGLPDINTLIRAAVRK